MIRDNKIYISLTFDDGRKDFFTQAFPVLKKYGLDSTLYAITGYIDGSCPLKLESSSGPISKEELVILDRNGVEIASHGDQHITSKSDSDVALRKLSSWLGKDIKEFGYSVPGSRLDDEELDKFEKEYAAGHYSYVRSGRSQKSRELLSKITYLIYSMLKNNYCYSYFNRDNFQSTCIFKRYGLKSVVVKSDDKEEVLINFIKERDFGDWIIFMFHSILDSGDKSARGAWYWNIEKFENFCASLAELRDKGLVKVCTVKQIVQNFDKE